MALPISAGTAVLLCATSCIFLAGRKIEGRNYRACRGWESLHLRRFRLSPNTPRGSKYFVVIKFGTRVRKCWVLGSSGYRGLMYARRSKVTNAAAKPQKDLHAGCVFQGPLQPSLRVKHMAVGPKYHSGNYNLFGT